MDTFESGGETGRVALRSRGGGRSSSVFTLDLPRIFSDIFAEILEHGSESKVIKEVLADRD